MRYHLPKRIHLSLITLVSVVCLAGCLESSFELAPESRLPKWLEPPNDVPRSDLRVTMDYYSTFSGGEYVFKLINRRESHTIKKIKVDISMAPRIQLQPKIQLQKLPSESATSYPSYSAVIVKGVADIIEFRRMEPVFYVTDDPVVWKALGALNK